MSDWILLHHRDGRKIHVRAAMVAAFTPLTSNYRDGSEVYVADADPAPFVVIETTDEIHTMLGIR